MSLAVYPGTFDPITNGHIDVIERAATLFDHIVVAVADSPDKNTHFDLAKRIELARAVFAGRDAISVEGFDGLLTEFLKQHQTNIVVRGLRAVSDFEYEFMLAGMNRKLMPSIETIYLMPSEEYMFVSSTFVREVAKLHGDVSGFVPEGVAQALL